jgi:hypothetical protein
MLFWVQIGSFVTGLMAAALWFRSSASKAPPMTWAGSAEIPGFLNKAARLNRWAAGVTAVSVLLSAVATLLSAKW